MPTPDRSRRVIRLLVMTTALLALAARCDADDVRAEDLASKRGAFETALPERSPLSAMPELAKRLGAKPDPAAEYDLSKETFWVYVPNDYDPAQKYGLIVYLNYKTTHSTPDPLQPTFDQSHLIYVSPSNSINRPDATQAGLALDAVHNLSKRLSIDPNRVYLIGATEASCKAGMIFGDVFTGTAYIFRVAFWHDVKLRSGNIYRAKLARPQGQGFAAAKKRPVAICNADEGDDNIGAAMAKAMLGEGFKSVTFIATTIEDAHYPNFKTDWFAKVLAVLDAAPKEPAVAAAHAPASAPTTPAAAAAAPVAPAAPSAQAAAAPSDAQRMLKLAKSYIAADRFAPARERLQTIVDKYPTDPAANEAKQLLEQIKGK